MKVAVALLAVGCASNGPRAWKRSVIITEQQHVRLALQSEPAKACHQQCLRTVPASACVRTCEGAEVVPGMCSAAEKADFACYDVITQSPARTLDGRCNEALPLLPGQFISACTENVWGDATTGGSVSTGVIVLFLAIGAVIAATYFVLGH